MDSYARLIERARQRDLVTLLDASGEALRQGVGGLPHILKVNEQELGALGVERSADIGLVADRLYAMLGEWASDALIVTSGAQGALAVTTEGAYLSRPPRVPVSNTAGAGDALDGGVMLARSRGRDWPEAMALGTAAAASVVMHEGTAICRREEVMALQSEARVDVL
jgi:fructose-1-phosphate kinase PfkB-like protein